MSSVSNINFPCIVKLGQLNKKKNQNWICFKRKNAHTKSFNEKNHDKWISTIFTSRKSFYFCLQQRRTDVLRSICMCQEMAKLHLGHSIYHLLCAVSMQFFSRALKYIMKNIPKLYPFRSFVMVNYFYCRQGELLNM